MSAKSEQWKGRLRAAAGTVAAHRREDRERKTAEADAGVGHDRLVKARGKIQSPIDAVQKSVRRK
jgi:hypothetical protein